MVTLHSRVDTFLPYVWACKISCKWTGGGKDIWVDMAVVDKVDVADTAVPVDTVDGVDKAAPVDRVVRVDVVAELAVGIAG